MFLDITDVRLGVFYLLICTSALRCCTRVCFGLAP